jgi:hypothetical protein
MDHEITLPIPRILDGEELEPAYVDVWCEDDSMYKFARVLIDGIAYENLDQIQLLLKCLGGVKRITKMANREAQKAFIRLSDEKVARDGFGLDEINAHKVAKLVGRRA